MTDASLYGLHTAQRREKNKLSLDVAWYTYDYWSILISRLLAELPNFTKLLRKQADPGTVAGQQALLLLLSVLCSLTLM